MRKLLLLSVLIITTSTIFITCSKDPIANNPYGSNYDPSEWTPSNLTLTEENIYTIKLTWQQAENNIDGFKIDKKVGTGSWQTTIATLDRNTKTYTDNEAVPTEQNAYRIYAYADENESNSVEENKNIDFPAPTNLQIQQINLSQLNLTWQDNSNGEDGFKIDRRVDNGSWSTIATVGENVRQYSDNSPIAYKDNQYRVYGYKNDKITTYLELSYNNGIPTPTNLTATAINDESIKLTWTDNCSFETGYKVERSAAGGSFAEIAELSANTTEYLNEGVTLGETYQYRVMAKTETNTSDYSNEVSTQTVFPPPTNLTATAINDESIQLTWDDNCSFETGYKVERSTAGGSFAEVADLSANSEQYTDDNITQNITYTYRVRAYTANNHSDYSSEQTFNVNVMTDIEGNIYRVVKIGNQWWMAENLRVTKYRNGESIQKVTDGTQWSNLDDNETPAYCAYNNDESNADTYGYLYNWYAVDDSRKIAPEGWHVPTDDEWQELEDFLTNNGHSGTEGKALKSTSGWSNNGNGTDDYSFAGLPAGYRDSNGAFYSIGLNAYFWSASEYSTNDAWTRGLYYLISDVRRYNGGKDYGFSVRCVRD